MNDAAVLIGGVLLAFLVGLGLHERGRRSGWAAFVGFATSVALYFPEGGPGLLLGMVIWPLFAMGIAAVGNGCYRALVMAGWIVDPREQRWEPRCAKCSYLLKGLTVERCPECGTPFDAATMRPPETRIVRGGR